MLSRKLFSQIKSVMIVNPTKRLFAFKVDSLKNVVKSEIAHEETNYTPVDKNELNQFYQSTNFKFREFNDSTKMELRKVENGHEITINFYSKPPTPEPEQDPNAQDQEASKLKIF